MDLKKFLENLRLKKMKGNQILIIFLLGILLMVIAVPVKEKDEDREKNYTEKNESLQNTSAATQYAQYLEQELERILSQMEGVGAVSCMVTLSQSAEQVIEKDMEISDDVVTEEDSQGGTRITNQSSRSETTIYNRENDGSPYVSKEISPKVEGVLVIAEGGNNAVVVKNITESLQALFGIESHKIRIVKKGVEKK